MNVCFAVQCRSERLEDVAQSKKFNHIPISSEEPRPRSEARISVIIAVHAAWVEIWKAQRLKVSLFDAMPCCLQARPAEPNSEALCS